MTKSTYFDLAVDKDMRLLAYDRRLRVNRELAALIGRHGLTHTSRTKAEKAAAAISKNPLVVRVVVTRVMESNAGVWRNGRES